MPPRRAMVGVKMMNSLFNRSKRLPIRVYVAGPMTAEDHWLWELNCRRAEGVSLSVMRSGLAPHCPHSQSRYWRDVVDYKTALAADKAHLAAAHVMLVGSGWQDSKGTKEEIEFCKKYGIPYFFSLENLLLAHKKGEIPDVIISRKTKRADAGVKLHPAGRRRKKRSTIVSWLVRLLPSSLIRGRKA